MRRGLVLRKYACATASIPKGAGCHCAARRSVRPAARCALYCTSEQALAGGGRFSALAKELRLYRLIAKSAGAGVARPASHWAHATALTKKWRLKELAKRAHAQ